MRTPSAASPIVRSTRSLLIILLLSAGAAACGGGGGSGGGVTNPGGGNPVTPVDPTATSAVTISGSTFSPKAIVVPPSTSVSFTNNDGIAHNVTFTDATIRSVADFSSGTQSATMPATPGTYDYRCTIHAGMNGTVKVQ